MTESAPIHHADRKIKHLDRHYPDAGNGQTGHEPAPGHLYFIHFPQFRVQQSLVGALHGLPLKNLTGTGDRSPHRLPLETESKQTGGQHKGSPAPQAPGDNVFVPWSRDYPLFEDIGSNKKIVQDACRQHAGGDLHPNYRSSRHHDRAELEGNGPGCQAVSSKSAREFHHRGQLQVAWPPGERVLSQKPHRSTKSTSYAKAFCLS